jgi:hypothetical protein
MRNPAATAVGHDCSRAVTVVAAAGRVCPAFSPMTFSRWPATVFVAAMLGLTAARAADPVTDALQAAYAPYRSALFRTNGRDAAAAQAALDDAQRRWQAVVERYGTGAPAPYAADAQWASTLREVSAVYERAEAQVRGGQLAQAHETLEQVRDLLAALRQRSQVVVYSDAMNAYHEVMEQVIGGSGLWLEQGDGWWVLMAEVGKLDYLAERLDTQAPAELKRDPDFVAGRKAVADSVAALRAAVRAQDKAATREAIGKLKPPYSRLFLRWG